MPRYKYYCDICFEIFEEWHSIQETLSSCSACGAPDCLTRVPSIISDHKKLDEIKKVGDITNDHIEKSRKDLDNFKRQIKTEDIKK